MEQEIVKLRSAIRDAEGRHAQERAAADALVASMRESGIDLTAKDNFEKVDEAYKRADSVKDEAVELRDRLARALEIAGEKVADAPTREQASKRAESLGLRFIDSDEYRALKESGSLRMQGARVNTAPVEVATRDEALDMLRMRATVTNAAGSGGGLIWSDRLGIVVPVPERSVRLLDVITVGETDSDTVEWAYESTRTHAAAETAYGTAAPESSYGWSKTSTTVKRIPHFVPATKGALADGGQLRTLLNSALVKGLRLRVENQVLKGDGLGENLKGIENTTGLGSIALGTDTRFDAVHKAITNVRVNYFEDPKQMLIHPNDFEQIVLEKDSAGNYTNGRSAVELGSVWGLTPVVTTLATEGTPLVGDFSEAVLWVREGVSVAASDSHSDFFLKGLVAILAEMRAAFAVLEAKAFCRVTGF